MWTWLRSANPPLVKARRRLSVDDDWWYARRSRLGLGRRETASKSTPLTMWPRNAGSSRSPTSSLGDERGLANCPAILPTLTIGSPDA